MTPTEFYMTPVEFHMKPVEFYMTTAESEEIYVLPCSCI